MANKRLDPVTVPREEALVKRETPRKFLGGKDLSMRGDWKSEVKPQRLGATQFWASMRKKRMGSAVTGMLMLSGPLVPGSQSEAGNHVSRSADEATR